MAANGRTPQTDGTAQPSERAVFSRLEDDMTLAEDVTLEAGITADRRRFHWRRGLQELPNLEYFEPGKPFSIASGS